MEGMTEKQGQKGLKDYHWEAERKHASEFQKQPLQQD